MKNKIATTTKLKRLMIVMLCCLSCLSVTKLTAQIGLPRTDIWYAFATSTNGSGTGFMVSSVTAFLPTYAGYSSTLPMSGAYISNSPPFSAFGYWVPYVPYTNTYSGGGGTPIDTNKLGAYLIYTNGYKYMSCFAVNTNTSLILQAKPDVVGGYWVDILTVHPTNTTPMIQIPSAYADNTNIEQFFRLLQDTNSPELLWLRMSEGANYAPGVTNYFSPPLVLNDASQFGDGYVTFTDSRTPLPWWSNPNGQRRAIDCDPAGPSEFDLPTNWRFNFTSNTPIHITISLFISTETLTTFIMGNGIPAETSGNGKGWYLICPSGKLALCAENGVMDYEAISAGGILQSSNPTNANWTMITVVWSDQTVSFYKNGALDSVETTGGYPASSDQPFTIANDSLLPSIGLDAQLWEVRIYNRILSATDVSNLYNTLTTGDGSGN